MAVRLAAGAHEFHVALLVGELGGAEVLIDVDVQVGGDEGGGGFGQLDAAAHGDDVDVGVVAAKQDVAHHTAHHVGGQPKLVGGLRNNGVDGVCQMLFVGHREVIFRDAKIAAKVQKTVLAFFLFLQIE